MITEADAGKIFSFSSFATVFGRFNGGETSSKMENPEESLLMPFCCGLDEVEPLEIEIAS